MTKGLESLAELKKTPAKKAEKETAAPAANDAAESKTPVIDELGRSYGTGRRKNSIARVWVKRGNGKITVNGKDFREYFARPTFQMIIGQTFTVAKREGEFDVIATVSGGGLSGQAGALRHGLSRALVAFEPGLRAALKPEGFLTRDSRAVERKKPGLRKARRRRQWKKR